MQTSAKHRAAPAELKARGAHSELNNQTGYLLGREAAHLRAKSSIAPSRPGPGTRVGFLKLGLCRGEVK